MKMHAGVELIDQILSSDSLPALPDSAQRLLELSNDADLYPAKLQSVLGNDPVLAARILQVANSAMFARQSKIGDLRGALALLGVRLALNISMGIAIVDGLRASETGTFNYELYWRKSVLGAIAANELYGTLQVSARGELFLAALLQDIGSLALLGAVGEKYERLAAATRNHLDLVEFERRAFGIDHAGIGAALAEHWQLPASTCDAIRSSHALLLQPVLQPVLDPEPGGLSGLQYGVAFAGVLAELWIDACHDSTRANDIIRAYLEKFGEARYRDTVASILASIPGANQLFSMQLLSEEQMASIA
ncbi:MAG: HDOD domain-containing protein [Pseudomonadales bacterium]